LRILQRSENGITRAFGWPGKLGGRYWSYWRLKAKQPVQPARQLEPTRAPLSGEVIGTVRAGGNQPGNRRGKVRCIGRRAVLVAHHNRLWMMLCGVYSLRDGVQVSALTQII